MIIQRMLATPDLTDTPSATALNGIAPITQLGVLRAVGDDAAKFLQGQLTQDVVLMPVGTTRLAALCSAKGRMLASFWVYKRSATELLLVTSADILPATLKKLSMFVLRAKLKLSDASGDFSLHGVLGNAIQSIAASAYPVSAGDQNDQESIVLELPPAGATARALWLAPAGAPAPTGPVLTEADWLRAEVLSGVARITQPVVDAFVPQMLNYESADGVNFKKGCYPGQEVVARSQFRGAIKRRAFVGQVEGDAQAGQEVFDAAQPDQPVGLIAQAAPPLAGRTDVIAAVQLAARSAADLRVGSADGAPLRGLHLPYALRDDI